MKKRIMSIILAGVIAASATAMVSAEDTAERAKGIVFTAESGYTANVYTGYVGGVAGGTVAGDLLGALDNANGVQVKRGDAAVDGADAVLHGDKLVLTAEDGTALKELTVIFMGNADKNAAVNLSDASTMLKYIANWENVDMDEVASDVDGNGAVNLTDVSTVLKKVANWDVDFVKDPVLPGKGDSRITSVIQTFSTGEVWPGSTNLRKGQDLAIKFSVGEGLYAKSGKTRLPSWGDTKGSIRLSLYKWDTDYETTVAAMPIATEEYVNLEDSIEVVFNFCDTAGKGVGEGEYLWRFHEGYDERVNPDDKNEPVGIGVFIKKFPAADSGVTLFYEGEVMTSDMTGEFGGPTEAFGPEAYIQLGK